MHSGLQIKVLNLYKQFLRASRNKHPSFTTKIKSEFRVNAMISKREVDYIEYLIRKGENQLEIIKSNQCDSIQI